MSLLLALTDTGGGGGVTGAAVTSQAQTTAITGTATVASVSGTLASSQAQTVAASGTASPASVSGTASTSQGQTSALSGNASPASVTGTVSTAEGQTTSASGSFTGSGVSGTGSTSQGQSTVSSGSVVNPETPTLQAAGRSSKKVFIEKDGKYLIFDSPSEARNYELAQKPKKVSKKSSKVVQLPQIKAPEIVPIVDNQILDDLIARFNLEYNRQLLQKQKDYEQLIFIQNYVAMLQDEEDIELLLLA
jgi:hypothetical protein